MQTRLGRNKGLDIIYQAQITRYIERVETLDQNLTRAYALIYSTYCNRTLQNRIEEHPNFETTIRDNLIELLKVIQILMHRPSRGKIPISIVFGGSGEDIEHQTDGK